MIANVKLTDKQILKKSSVAAILISSNAIYSFQSFKRIAVLSALILLILLLAHHFLSNTKSHWIIKFVLISLVLIAFSNFYTSALFWIVWNFLVCFVLLRPKSNFGTVKILCSNLLIFVLLFSLVEVAFRAAYDNGLRVSDVIDKNQDSGVFVNIKEKDFFKVAVQESQARLVDGPGAEYDLLHREKIKRSGDLITLGDFDGLYINVEDGRRVTTGSTGLREKRILVFGGSTILCGELPDSMTVTSNLQKILNSDDLEFDVLNYGISGLRIENQFKILETVRDLNSNDIVVFYDGINDLNRIFEEGLERRANQTPSRQFNKIAKELEKRSLLFRDISITNYLDGLGVSQAYLANEVGQQITDNWIKFDAMARKYVESKGAKFVHILQPNWLTLESVNNSTKLKKHWSDRKIIQSAFEKSVTPETKIKDLTKIFDDLGTTPFLDWAHVDEVGTAKVAEEMFAVLEPLLTK